MADLTSIGRRPATTTHQAAPWCSQAWPRGGESAAVARNTGSVSLPDARPRGKGESCLFVDGLTVVRAVFVRSSALL